MPATTPSDDTASLDANLAAEPARTINGADSAISPAELQSHLQLDATASSASLARMDANGDGVISSSEMLSYLSQAGVYGDARLSASDMQALAPLFASDTLQTSTAYVAPSIAVVVADVLNYFGAASTGLITPAELATAQGMSGLDASAFAAQVAKIDSNGDGAISTAELTAYVGAADVNADGHISAPELHTLVPLIGMALHAVPGGLGHG